MEDLVDILVTTYNTPEQYLKEQLDSIINQTYNNIKIYISDDASNNNINTVLKEYQKKDNRISFFKQKQNLGYVKNFEFLLTKSTANYIMFCDHDDVWYKDKVKKSLNKLKKENVSLVYCNARQIDKNGITIKRDYFEYKNLPKIKGKNNNIAISRAIGIGCSQIITKDVKDEMIPFKKGVISHDWLSSFIANNQKGIDYIEEILFDYRLHSTNVFGGTTATQKIRKWNKLNGKSYKSFLKYRRTIITKTYLAGVAMCLDYTKSEQEKVFIQNAVKYYNSLEKSSIFNVHIFKYFKILGYKRMYKKLIKEITIFHFPIIAYMWFLIV